MRLLRVLNDLRPSGVEAGLRATADLWRDAGVHTDILVIGPEPGPYAPALAEAGYPVYHLPLKPPRAFFPAYLRFFREHTYDLVHVHPENGNFYVVGLARLVAARAVVRSFHNVFAYSGSLRVRRGAQRAVLRGLGVTNVSVSASVQAAEWRGFRNTTGRIYNGFDETRFFPAGAEARAAARERVGASAEEFVVAIVGNCLGFKNHTAALHATAALARSRPVRIVHAGLEKPGEPERELAARLGLHGSAVFLGQVDDVAPILHAADCFVMPSLYEGLGNAALEALGCGVPSVLGDVAGLADLRAFFPEAVWWVPPEAPAITAALEEVAAGDVGKDPATRNRLAATAREHFSSRRAVDQYLRLYRDLLSQRQGTPVAGRLLGA